MNVQRALLSIGQGLEIFRYRFGAQIQGVPLDKDWLAM
jgi:hypothetical protein